VTDSAHRLARAYLAIADRLAPGLVEGLYLQGSVALGDYREGVSDVDFVAVVPPGADPRTLRRIHSELRQRHPRPDFDGLYVTADHLRDDPDHVPAGPSMHARRFQDLSRFERNLVTWHVLAQGGISVRGPAVDELAIHTDWPELARRTEVNLATYWTGWAASAGRLFSPAGAASPRSPQVAWGVLGVTRLRHSLAAGEVTSKTAAAGYALEVYPERWHRIAREALRIRTGGAPLYRDPLRRRGDLLAYLGMVLATPSAGVR
jgi:hypothetical protein